MKIIPIEVKVLLAELHEKTDKDIGRMVPDCNWKSMYHILLEIEGKKTHVKIGKEQASKQGSNGYVGDQFVGVEFRKIFSDLASKRS